MPRSRFRIIEVDGVKAKPCSKCSVTKSLEEFWYRSAGLGRRGSICKSCQHDRDKRRSADPAQKNRRRAQFIEKYYSPDAIAQRAVKRAEKEASSRETSLAMGKEFVSRPEAVRRGLSRYFNGQPCPKGHIADRITASRACEVCRTEVMANYHHNNRANILARKKRLYLATAAKQRARSRAYYAENKEKHREAHNKWKLANPEKYRSHQRHHNNLRRGDRGRHTAEDIADIRRQQKNRCAYCRISLANVREHIDHIQPIIRGGVGVRSNLQLLCQPCNNKKHAKDPIAFAQELGMLL